MTNQEKFNMAFIYFKKGYDCKMRGTQTVELPNGKKRYFDDRLYYEGRGKKYNDSIKHDDKGTVKVSRKEYSEFLSLIKRRKEEALIKERQVQKIKDAEKAGIYLIEDNYVILSELEQFYRKFDAERLANTLNIQVDDAKLLQSPGKTYVFAKTSEGKILELYHPSFKCNKLSIYVAEATAERVAEFNDNRKSWTNAPFSDMVGQTDNPNHYVC